MQAVNGQKDRQAVRQTDSQKDSYSERQPVSETGRQKDRKKDIIQEERKSDEHIVRKTGKQADIETE